jgi:hypothetical protein
MLLQEAAVSFIRNQERMVYQTVMDHLESQLTTLGWLEEDPTLLPFGATVPLTWMEGMPEPKLEVLKPNTVAFTEGDTPDDQEGELGAVHGGLWSVEHTFFVDIYGESLGVAKALASDVRAILNGKMVGAARFISLTDYSLTPPATAPGHLLHFEDVEVTRPVAQPSKLRWEVVKATCVHEFHASEG